jgi:ribosome maturation factor RimP
MKEKVKMNIVKEIESVIEPTINSLLFKLVDIDVLGGKNRHIIVYIYKNESIGLNDLESLSRNLQPLIEKIESLKSGFNLEISSPGLFRTFKYIKEFDIFKGRLIKIILDDGAEKTGILKGMIDKNVLIINNNEIESINIEKIKNAKLNG